MSEKKTARDMMLKKKHGGVHPELVDDYLPKFPIDIPEFNDKNAYGNLTDQSSYSEYAWAFLKRNRFYQRFVDKKLPAIEIENWGFRSHEQINYDYALLRKKPYNEEHDAGTPLQWHGIHDFPGRLVPLNPRDPRMGRQHIEVEFPECQVALIFDIDPMLGAYTTAIDQQIAMARTHLEELAEAAKFSIPRVRSRKAQDKTNLRDQLRVADLLSSPKSISIPKENNGTRLAIPVELSAKSPLTIRDVADLLSKFEMTRKSSNGGKEAIANAPFDSPLKGLTNNKKESKEQLLSRMSALSVDASDNIYNWKFLNWLQFDKWNHLMAPSKAARIQSA